MASSHILIRFNNMAHSFEVGKTYTREQVMTLIGVPTDVKGGNWYTGYARNEDDWFIFCNIGVAGTTGHDYNNRWQTNHLVWFGKTGSHPGQPTIQVMTGPKGDVYIFSRQSNRDRFTYQGRGTAVSIRDTTPVEITWALTP